MFTNFIVYTLAVLGIYDDVVAAVANSLIPGLGG